MQFLASPFAFAWLLLAVIPIALYLLFRRKRKDVAWGAIYILRRLLESKHKISAWKQYVIVALRTLAFAALAFAFLGPHLRWRMPPDGSFPPPPSSTHRLVLLDVSASMDAGFGSGTCMDAAFSLCRKILKSGRFPGRVDILPLDGRDVGLAFESLPADDAAIEAFIGELERGEGRADIERGLHRAVQIFRASPFRHKELYVLSDFSARDLAEPSALSGLFRSLDRMDVRRYGLSYAGPDARNFALRDFTPCMDVLLAGQPTLFYVTVGYYGAAATADTWLTVRDDQGNTLYEDALSLAQGEKTIELALSLSAGDRVLTAALRDDDLRRDNRLERSFHVRDTLRLLVVQDINLAKGFGNPRAWLKLALGEGGGGAAVGAGLASMIEHGKQLQSAIGKTTPAEAEPGAGPADDGRYKTVADYVNSVQVGPGVFDQRDGAVFLDVAALPPEGVAAARRYAVRGGTLFLAPGPTADPATFNATFSSVSPALLGPPALEAIDPNVYENAVLEAADDRLLRELEAPRQGDIGNARFYNRYQVDPETLAEDSDVWFSLSDGAPLCLFRRIGRGGCILWTAGLGMDWQSMVVHPAYPVFFSRLFNAAAARRAFGRNLEPGQAIIADVEVVEPVVVDPAGNVVPLVPVAVDDRRLVRYDDTRAPGVYRIRPKTAEASEGVIYTVRKVEPESDYRPVAGDNLASLEQGMDRPLNTSETQLFESLGTGYLGRPLMAAAAFVLLAGLLLEAGLARRWFT